MIAEGIPVLTLWQPWASLIPLGVKSIETRSWSTKYRGPLAIHAAARRPDLDGFVGSWYAYEDPPGYSMQEHPGGAPHPLPLGAIVATCTLVDVVPIHKRANDSTWNAPYVLADDRLWRNGHHFAGHPLDRRERDWDFAGQRPYGDFTAGRFAWLLADVVPVDPPVPFKGARGLTRRWVPLAA